MGYSVLLLYYSIALHLPEITNQTCEYWNSLRILTMTDWTKRLVKFFTIKLAFPLHSVKSRENCFWVQTKCIFKCLVSFLFNADSSCCHWSSWSCKTSLCSHFESSHPSPITLLQILNGRYRPCGIVVPSGTFYTCILLLIKLIAWMQTRGVIDLCTFFSSGSVFFLISGKNIMFSNC